MQNSAEVKIAESCDYGKQFAEIFYEKLDKGRHSLLKLYHREATLVWNGNAVKGNGDIVVFFEKLPGSETHLLSVDAQPVEDLPQIQNQKMMSVLCSGKMKFPSASNNFMNFTESFLLVAETDNDSHVWKIISDVYRTH
ncbi:NTF2-related export protein 1-like protein [Leptotrombidium deliense]|uniref:NTF2-related export protein n=1 Tax=Leptotrombidium deliense TaxID=299467 RepID=A0A443SFH1_9ACAR|nr:NTF2-related export protein 1-like protein [Leptotrombidium deliense]